VREGRELREVREVRDAECAECGVIGMYNDRHSHWLYSIGTPDSGWDLSGPKITVQCPGGRIAAAAYSTGDGDSE
jgi:hypothetical protein